MTEAPVRRELHGLSLRDALQWLVHDTMQATPTAVRVPLIPPFSVNAAFANVPGRGRVKTKAYKQWRAQQAMEIVASGARRRAFRKAIVILRVPSSHIDMDNVTKGYIDALVDTQILADDDKLSCVVLMPAPDGAQGFAYIIPD